MNKSLKSAQITKVEYLPRTGDLTIWVDEQPFSEAEFKVGTQTQRLMEDLLYAIGHRVDEMQAILDEPHTPILHRLFGDGVADDSTAFQNAINDAHALTNGGYIFVPGLSFKIVSNSGRGGVMNSYKIEVEVSGEEGKWHTNAIRILNENEAKAYAADLYSRWTLVKQYRVVESEDYPNYRFFNGRLEQLER